MWNGAMVACAVCVMFHVWSVASVAWCAGVITLCSAARHYAAVNVSLVWRSVSCLGASHKPCIGRCHHDTLRTMGHCVGFLVACRGMLPNMERFTCVQYARNAWHMLRIALSIQHECCVMCGGVRVCNALFDGAGAAYGHACNALFPCKMRLFPWVLT